MSDATEALKAHIVLHLPPDGAVVRRLLAEGADPNARDANGHTALEMAAFAGDVALARHLLDAGAAPDPTDGSGAPLLFLLADWMSERPVVRPMLPLLLAAGADVDAADPKSGQTALMRAVCRNDPETVRLLLAAGASLQARDAKGRTPLVLARQCENAELVARLAPDAGTGGLEPDPEVATLRGRILEALQSGATKYRIVEGGFKYEYDVVREIHGERGRWVEAVFDEYPQELSVRPLPGGDDALLEHLLRDVAWMRGRFPPRDRYEAVLARLQPRGADDLVKRAPR